MTGMTRDMSANRFTQNFACDARNIRITARDGNSLLLAVTNEKGTAEYTIMGQPIVGMPIGTAVLNRILVLFTTNASGQNPDHIYKLDFAEDYSSAVCSTLFAGDLNFDYKHPLETLPMYENAQIQKVYWLDGVNQPRMVNIMNGLQHNGDVFNFVRKVELNHTFNISKMNSGGQFPSGTIQYCFSYFNKFAQETPIIEASSLYYLAPKERGLAADGSDASSFKIVLNNLDKNFEYVRIYAITRTSEGAVPAVRVLGDFKVGEVVHLNPWDTVSDYTTQSGHTYIPVHQSKLWVVDGNSGEKKYSMLDVYGEGGDYVVKTLTLENNEYLYDEENERYYTYMRFDRGGNITGRIETINFFWHAGDFGIEQPTETLVYLCRTTANEVINQIVTVDHGANGSTIDSAALLFLGGQNIIAKTFAAKDNTLFLGNLTNQMRSAGSIQIAGTTIKDYVKTLNQTWPYQFDAIGQKHDEVAPAGHITPPEYGSGLDFYDYPIDNNRPVQYHKWFKSGENYRLGFIAQDEHGNWSEAIWLGDFTETKIPVRFRPSFSTRGGHNRYMQFSNYFNCGFMSRIPQNVLQLLYENNYRRIAPVVVYPKALDRFVVCQGLLAGTVFNVGDRIDNSPYVQADWRFRMGYSWERIDDEIQVCSAKDAPFYPGGKYHNPNVGGNPVEKISESTFRDAFNEYFYRDAQFLTFHSPDIEFTDDVLDSDFKNLKMRIVGISNHGYYVDNNIGEESTSLLGSPYPTLTASAFMVKTENQGWSSIAGIIEKSPTVDSGISWYYSGGRGQSSQRVRTVVDTLTGYNGYRDLFLYWNQNNDLIHHDGWMFNWKTYLWHRHGSLNNQSSLTTKDVQNGYSRTALLKHKVMAELKYSLTTFLKHKKEVPIGDIAFFDSSRNSLAKLKVGDKEILYYGNIDKVISPSFSKFLDSPVEELFTHENFGGVDKTGGYPIETSGVSGYDTTYGHRPQQDSNDTERPEQRAEEFYEEHQIPGKDPVYMKYSTPRHLVIPLTNADGEICHFDKNNPLPFAEWLFWDDYYHNSRGENVDPSQPLNFVGLEDADMPEGNFKVGNSVYVAELYREFTPDELASRFGGNSDEALSMNDWTICGNAVPINPEDEYAELLFTEGDTYVGRYDCLKSYPTTQDDENSVISIFSTEIESRVNLDLRYDKNRGLVDNTLVTPQNFNRFNRPGYEQTRQYFTYHSIDYQRYRTLQYPNMITWSLEKTMGADVDKWLNISLTSTMDLDGDKGEITSLQLFKNEIFAFQNRAFSQILFNSRVQIPVSDGMPIEITNGYKVGGKKYISDQIGVTNKWSILSTPNGLYFVDDEKDNLYLMSDSLIDLSLKLGFKTWFNEQSGYESWNPVDYGGIRTFYDKVNGDVYFTTKNEALVYSEQLNTFVSFMDYGNLPTMLNINDKFLTFTKDKESDALTAWEFWAGPYNSFFGEFHPYWLTFIANADPSVDKVFNNLEWRTMSYTDADGESGYLSPMSTFDTVRVWNDHQDTGDVALTTELGKPSVLKKKFNAFRTCVPRDKRGDWALAGRDRIRNPWAYIQLSRYKENYDFTIFTDMAVDYFE